MLTLSRLNESALLAHGKYKVSNIALCFLILFLVTACEAPEQSRFTNHEDAHGHGVEEEAHGPHGGRLLVDGDFAVEMGIDEAGKPPRWKLYTYWQNETLPPEAVKISVHTTRLDGDFHRFELNPEFDALVSTDIVTEPHSFDVEVRAEYQGKAYRWSYPSYEGRTQIAQQMALDMGLQVEPTGAVEIEERLDVLGRIDFAPNALVTLRAQFPGRVVKVLKQEGERVVKNEVLAVIEANESLRQYELRTTMAGIVIERGTNVGDVVDTAALFRIGDPSNLRVSFHIYPGDFSRIRPGQKVDVYSVDGVLNTETKLTAYLPTTEAETQTIIAYAELPNDDEQWLPGMTVAGSVVVDDSSVPLAVRTQAIQRFRDWPVVFAKVGQTYEVRMLALGRQTEEWTEVLGGIKPGQEYVVENSFLIKADIEKDGASHDH